MRTCDRHGVQTAFDVQGDGPPLLMIHGAEADHRMFAPLTDRLARHFTCIVYDQRDSGQTTATDPGGYTVDDLADDAAAVIDAAGFARAHVFGTSLGGQIAQHLAARHDAAVDRLVLGNTWQSGLRLADIHSDTAVNLAYLRKDRSAHAEQIAEFFHPREFLDANPSAVEGFGRNARNAAQQARRAALMEQVNAADLGRIKALTLIIAGQRDRLVAPAVTLQLLEHIPGSLGTVLRDAGHVPCIHATDALADTLRRFLEARFD